MSSSAVTVSELDGAAQMQPADGVEGGALVHRVQSARRSWVIKCSVVVGIKTATGKMAPRPMYYS